MGKKDPRVDKYIEEASAFAKPILNRFRSAVHNTCPDVEEGIKWGFPAFDYHGYLCGMAAHKAHCSITLWKGALMDDPHKLLEIVGKTGMGQLGRIESEEDLPSDDIVQFYLKQGMKLNEEGVKAVKPSKAAKVPEMPGDFAAALADNPRALEHYDGFSNYNKKEYLEWVLDAKRESTRAKRIAQSVEWIAEGKVRNWKYM